MQERQVLWLWCRRGSFEVPWTSDCTSEDVSTRWWACGLDGCRTRQKHASQWNESQGMQVVTNEIANGIQVISKPELLIYGSTALSRFLQYYASCSSDCMSRLLSRSQRRRQADRDMFIH